MQDTYNPITGEYVKKIGDWISLEGSLPWSYAYHNATSNSVYLPKANIPGTINGITTVFKGFKYDSTECVISDTGGRVGAQIALPIKETGFSPNVAHFVNEYKAYFYGWRMANADGTSPYYRSEVPYNPTTWAEWTATAPANVTKDITGIEWTSQQAYNDVIITTPIKATTKYGILYNVVSTTCIVPIMISGGTGASFNVNGVSLGVQTAGIKKTVLTSMSSPTGKFGLTIGMTEPVGNKIKLKDIRIFELPTGSQIEADFTNLSADELSARYTFNGLCLKHWKKVTDGTGLTSTLPTASYAGYTPYKMIYQLATPEISYLTPKTEVPLYTDKNTYIETSTLSNCKADVTVGYKLKSGAIAVGGDIVGPTPDYPIAVVSTSETSLSKGSVRSPNIIVNGSFSNGITGWSAVSTTSTYRSSPACGYKQLPASGAAQDIASGKPGDKIYVSGYIKSGAGSTANIGIFDLGGFLNKRTIGSTSSTSFSRVSGITEIQNTNGFKIDIGTTTGEAWYDDMFVCNLTASYGAGNEPTKAQCDVLFATWQDKAITETTLPTLRKIGTVADSFNPETGKIVRRIGKKVFNGTESWSTQVNNAGNNYITQLANTYYVDISDASTTDTNDSLSNMFKYSQINNYNDTSNRDNLIGTVHRITPAEKRRFFRISNEEIGINYDTIYPINDATTTLVKFKAWLSQKNSEGNPVCLYYVLETPVIETSSVINMATYGPVSVIDCIDLVKPIVKSDYKLKPEAIALAGDFMATPECTNDIKDLGSSVDVVSSIGKRNVVRQSNEFNTGFSHSTGIVPSITTEGYLQTVTEYGNGNWFSGWVKTHTGIESSFNEGDPYTISFTMKSPDHTVSPDIYLKEGMGYFRLIGTMSTEFSVFSYSGTWKKSNNLAFHFGLSRVVGTTIIKNWKIEKSSTLSNWTPAIEDVSYNISTDGVYKNNIALSAPLRSIGNLRDRLFKDSDGKWKVERNIGEKVFNGTETWTHSADTNWNKDVNVYEAEISLPGKILVENSPAISSHFPKETFLNHYGWISKGEKFSIHSSTMMPVTFNIERLSSLSVNAVKEWCLSEYNKGTPLTVQYQLATPTYETLSQELQTRLDNIPTFAGGNYVYTVANDNLQPTLHVDYKKLSWLKSRLLLNSLKIYSRNLTDAEMEQNYRIEKERYGM